MASCGKEKISHQDTFDIHVLSNFIKQFFWIIIYNILQFFLSTQQHTFTTDLITELKTHSGFAYIVYANKHYWKKRSNRKLRRRYICSQEKAPVKTDTINQHNSTNVTVQRTQKGLRTRLVIDQLPYCSVYINIISLGLKPSLYFIIAH